MDMIGAWSAVEESSTGSSGLSKVETDSGPIGVTAPRQCALLISLLTSPNRSVQVETLIDALWDDDPPASAAKLVPVFVSAAEEDYRINLDRETHPNAYRIRWRSWST